MNIFPSIPIVLLDLKEFYSVESPKETFEEFKVQFQSYLHMTNTERPHWGPMGKIPFEALQSYQ